MRPPRTGLPSVLNGWFVERRGSIRIEEGPARRTGGLSGAPGLLYAYGHFRRLGG